MIRTMPHLQTAQHLLPGQVINPLPPETVGLFREAAVTPEERQAVKLLDNGAAVHERYPGQLDDLPLHKCGERCNINCLNWRARQGMLGHFPMGPMDPQPAGVTATDKAS